MYATDYVQIYTLMLGFYFNNKALESMMLMGLHYLPFAYCILKNFAEVKKAGDDEGDAASLFTRYVLVDLLKMFAVILLFVIPLGSQLTITPQDIIKSTCGASGALISEDIPWADTVNKIVFNDNQTQWEVENKIFNSQEPPPPQPDHDVFFQGVTSKSPVALSIAHNGTVILSSMLASSMPCGTDIRTIKMKESVALIPDVNTALQEGIQVFFAQCYQPNIRDLLSRTTNNTYNFENKLWPGADVFTMVGGLYANNSHAYSIDKATWHRVKQIEQGTPEPSISESDNPTKPSEFYMGCNDAYDSLTKGLLRERDAQQESQSSVLSGIQDLYRNVTGWTQAKQDEADLKALFSELSFMPVTDSYDDLFARNRWGTVYGREGNSYGNIATQTLGAFGLGFSRIGAAAETHLQRVMAPMFYSITGMIIVGLFPIVVILSGYNAKVTIALTVGLMVASSSSLMLALAEWVDSILLPLVTASNTTGADQNSRLSQHAAAYVGSISFQWIPILWAIIFSLLGTAFTQAAAASFAGVAKGLGNTGMKLSSKLVGGG